VKKRSPSPETPAPKGPTVCEPTITRQAHFKVNAPGMTVPLDAVRKFVTAAADFPGDSEVLLEVTSDFSYMSPRHIVGVRVTQPL